RVLVTGGGGYVGSITAERLLAEGHPVTILDSLVTGHSPAVPPDATVVEGTVDDREAVLRAVAENGIEGVVHCAARSLVGESVNDPALYYRENVVGGIAFLDTLREAGVRRIVFSSSAAVYGEPESIPILESQPARPVNPYGETKLAFEGALRWYSRTYGIRAVSLRYFNVAGATEERGEDHQPETHLIPNVLAAAAGGAPVTIFGTDYPTPDGTCIRDYIHVADLADAHMAALRLESEPGLEIINLGSGSGFSVLEVLRAAEGVVESPVPHVLGPRRAGDPPVLVASNDLARERLGWTPRRGSLEEMIGSAWAWRQRHPRGYADGQHQQLGAASA
ncbi:MAG TPA: UDP-glucose 4-epimerase GalE, partial [Candidatus Caenarcaniphilales bacterium]|nr:UDP-glucose 4-epimerase GalE [Candidatus Caenarcaniphilales bacterium]